MLGTLVHSFLGKQFGTWAQPRKLQSWANQENRTIISNITGQAYPRAIPYRYKPDLVSWAGAGAAVNLYEAKHADLILDAPFYVGKSLFATGQLTTKGFFPLSAMAPSLAFGFGTAFAPGYTVWPGFVYSPPGWQLVTWNDYTRFPGVILYDWVPTKVGVTIEALKGVSAIGAAYVIQRIAAINGVKAAAATGTKVVLAERNIRLGAGSHLGTAASIGFVGLSVGIGF